MEKPSNDAENNTAITSAGSENYYFEVLLILLPFL